MQFRRYALLILVLFSSTPLLTTELTDVSPDKVEFAWDAHDVLLQRNYLAMVKVFFQGTGFRGISILGNLVWEYTKYLVIGTQGKTLKVAQDVYVLLKRQPGGTWQEFKSIVEGYDPKLGVVGRKMAAQFDPIDGMPALLQELHELGYIQRIATNMGPEEYKNLQERHPDFFKYLDGGLTVDIFEKPEIVRKPYDNYFARYHERYNANKSKTVVFTDDNKFNVVGAQKAAMIAILFKNTYELRKALKEIGIPIN